MNFNNLINQVLGAAKQYGGQSDQSGILGKLGGGAAAAGLLSLLLKKGSGKKIAQAGSMAALGALAYAAYQKYRENPPQASAPQNGTAVPPMLPEQAFSVQQDSETAGRVILRTMIAAAAADGTIDEAERAPLACRRSLSCRPFGVCRFVAQGNCLSVATVASLAVGRRAGGKFGKTGGVLSIQAA